MNLQDTLISEKGTQCEECEEGPAVVFCKECNATRCEVCKKHHLRSVTTKQHKLLSIKEIRSKSGDESFEGVGTRVPWKCDKHKKQDVAVYCIKCDVMICRDCGMTDHNLHDKSIENSTEGTDFKVLLEQNINDTRTVLTSFEEAIAGVEKMKVLLKSSKESARNAVTARHRELVEKLDRQKEELLSKADAIFKCKQENLDEQLDDLRAVERLFLDSTKFADDILTVGIPEEILFLKKKIQARMEQLRNDYRDYNREPVDNDIITFRQNEDLDLHGAIGSVKGDAHVPHFSADGISRLHLIQSHPDQFTVVCRDIIGNGLPESTRKLSAQMRWIGDGGEAIEVGEGGGAGNIGENGRAGGVGEAGDIGEDGQAGDVGDIGDQIGDIGEDAEVVEVRRGDGIGEIDVGVSEKCPVESVKPGEYCVRLTPRKAGKYELTVGVEERCQLRHISGSPFAVTVFPEPAKVECPRSTIRDPQHLESPWGVAVNKQGLIVVSDVKNDSLVLFQEREDSFDWIKSIGKTGSEPLEFKSPRGVAFNPTNGHIVVVEKENHRVQILTSDGTSKAVFGNKGAAIGQFHSPTDVAVNSEGVIFVTDSINQRIQYFTSDGLYIGWFGQWGSAQGMLNQPYAITVDDEDQVLVTERDGNRVQVFQKKEDNKYNSVLQFGKLSNEDEHLAEPVGIAYDPQSRYICVTELKSHRVSVFSATGRYISSFGSRGTNDNQFLTPLGIAILGGELIVADCSNKRLSLFVYKK